MLAESCIESMSPWTNPKNVLFFVAHVDIWKRLKLTAQSNIHALLVRSFSGMKKNNRRISEIERKPPMDLSVP
jgi:hypothetical protein